MEFYQFWSELLVALRACPGVLNTVEQYACVRGIAETAWDVATWKETMGGRVSSGVLSKVMKVHLGLEQTPLSSAAAKAYDD